MLNDDILNRLRNETLTKSFQISLDTLNPDLYSRIHSVPPEMLTTVLNTLRSIKKAGFHTTVSTRLTPHTLSGIPQLLDRACEEGWATVTIHIPLLIGRSIDAFTQNTDFLTLLEPAFEHFIALPATWLIEMYIPWAQYHPTTKRIGEKIKVMYVGCRAGRDRLTINPCGDISVCVCFDVPELYLGNIRKDDLSDVFQNSRICDMMLHPEKYGICKNCANVMTCGGGCRVAAYAITGRFEGQDESCPVYKHRAAGGNEPHSD
jgi:radical SAM protein with 4Fe4S-binding SPASM domain